MTCKPQIRKLRPSLKNYGERQPDIQNVYIPDNVSPKDHHKTLK